MTDDEDDVAAALAGERRDRVPPADIESRVVSALRESGHLRARTRRPPVWLVTSLGMAASLALGVWIGIARPWVPVAPAAAQKYLLLLYVDADYREVSDRAELVREFRAWTRPLVASDHMTSGEELRSSGVEITATKTAAPVSNASVSGEPQGFFVIKAVDQAEAIEIAKTCPHLTHGGRIVVRPIVGQQ